MDIFSLLRLAKSKGASDLHLLSSSQPLFRIDGSLEAVADTPPLTTDDLDQMFNQIASER